MRYAHKKLRITKKWRPEANKDKLKPKSYTEIVLCFNN